MEKKISKKCDKCSSGTKKEHIFIHSFGQTYNLCAVCFSIFETLKNSSLIELFLRDNSSQDEDLDLTQISRNILQAREARRKGESPWKNKTNNPKETNA